MASRESSSMRFMGSALMFTRPLHRLVNKVIQFGLGGLTLADHGQIPERHHAQIALLHQQAAVDALEVKPLRRGSPLAAFQQTHVLLGCHRLAGSLADAGCDDHLDELTGDDGRRSGTIQLAV